jgi:predicted lipid carrier protein YhbT
MDAMPADSGSWSDWLGESARRAGAAASDAALSESADALRGRGETLLWRTTDESSLDASTAWYIERRPDGVQWQHRDDTADVTVSGPARSLLLILTRRVGPTYGQGGSVTIDGDVDLVRDWIQHTAHDAG